MNFGGGISGFRRGRYKLPDGDSFLAAGLILLGWGGGMAMNVRFYIDPEKGYPHIYSHGVVEGEVEDVLLLPGEDRPGRGGARIATGMTAAGRCLRVI